MSMDKLSDLQYTMESCNHCGRCVGRCPFHALDNGTYGYKVYIGGRWGKHVAQGHAIRKVFTSEEDRRLLPFALG